VIAFIERSPIDRPRKYAIVGFCRGIDGTG